MRHLIYGDLVVERQELVGPRLYIRGTSTTLRSVEHACADSWTPLDDLVANDRRGDRGNLEEAVRLCIADRTRTGHDSPWRPAKEKNPPA
ncbi:hypothetical protein [Aureimonas endophytica]|nr:hypothetical protein [Aureimonas endophytica]